jgi:hypothetical protein
MLPNLILVAIALFILVFIGLMWLRQALLYSLANMERRRQTLQKDLKKRRDQVPLLLEAFKLEAEPNEAWQNFLQARTELHGVSDLHKEWVFEGKMLNFIHLHKLTGVTFLEAKKDIDDSTGRIEAEKSDWEKSVESYEALRKSFPYKIASGIFGFQKIDL